MLYSYQHTGGNLAFCIRLKDVPQGAPYQEVTDPAHYINYPWHDALVMGGGAVGTDMAKAREHCHAKRRNKREAMMAADVDIVKKAAAGIPLAASENSAEAAQRNTDYMALDTVAQGAINAASDAAGLFAIYGTEGYGNE